MIIVYQIGCLTSGVRRTKVCIASHGADSTRVEHRSKPGVDARLGDVPDGGSFNNIPDHELPDRLYADMNSNWCSRFPKTKSLQCRLCIYLVLGDALGAVGAADILDVAPAVLVASVVPPLGRHLLQMRGIIIKGRQRHTINLSLNTARQFQ